MNELDLKIQEEIKKLINHIFEPIKGEFVSFGKPFNMYCSTLSPYSTEGIMSEKNKITYYPMTINTKFGELDMSIQSIYLSNLKAGLGIAFGYCSMIGKNKLSEEVLSEIQKRIYS